MEQPRMVVGYPSCKPRWLLALDRKLPLLLSGTIHILTRLLFQLLDLDQELYMV